MFKVKKSDGTLEDFDRGKIVRGILRSGGTDEEAEKIATEIDNWLPTAIVEGVVSSVQIREQLLNQLRILNPTAASDFETYEKPVPESQS
jgi:transcriptional regulator NrdR family protein